MGPRGICGTDVCLNLRDGHSFELYHRCLSERVPFIPKYPPFCEAEVTFEHQNDKKNRETYTLTVLRT